MDDHVLVPFDGSPAARVAVEHTVERFPEARLTVLYVMDPMAEYSRRQSYPGYTREDEHRNEREKAETVVEAALELVPDGVEVDTDVVAGDPARSIVQYVDDSDVTHVVIGSHSRKSVARYLFGSVAETVVRRSAVPVTVVRPEE